MSLEPSIAGMVAAADGAAAAPQWSAYRACPVCRARAGEPCTAMYTAIVQGRPGGPVKQLSIAHGHRKRRHGR